MILNSGLDAACTNNTGASGPVGTDAGAFLPWINYAAFGTGSAAPTASDTALGSQVGSRSTSNGGFGNSIDGGHDSINDIIWTETTFTRVFTIASNVNATEWGLAAGSTGNLSVRELFRTDPTDNASSPITLTLENGDELQLVVTLRVQADWVSTSKSFVITGTAGNDSAGTHTGNAGVNSGSATTSGAAREAVAAVWPGGIQDFYSNQRGGLWRITVDASSKGKADNISGSYVAGFSAASYTPGDFYRDDQIVMGTSSQNGDHYGWVAGHSSSGVNSANRGLRFALTSPAKLTKASTHKLTLTVRKSISRL